ncbi:MAG: alpha/beta hydrolase [Flavobacteriaceae bacterium]|nr:alpha/beta hydrolase [Flavobacteriaceae bacterium]
MKTINFAGSKLSYRTLGSQGYVLVLVHGFCEDSRVWRLQEEELSKTCRIILLDLPGFGQSEMIGGEYSLERLAESVKYILDEESIGKCTLVGHSMGGYVALAFAEKYPERLNGFGLFHSTALADSEEKKANRIKSAEFIRQNGSEPFVRTLTPSLFAPTFTDQNTIDELMQMGNACLPETLAAATEAMMNRPDRTHILKETKVPVLFAVGVLDVNVPQETLLPQCSYPETSMVELFENTAHMGMREQPNKALNLLSEFVKLFDKTQA